MHVRCTHTTACRCGDIASIRHHDCKHASRWRAGHRGYAMGDRAPMVCNISRWRVFRNIAAVGQPCYSSLHIFGRAVERCELTHAQPGHRTSLAPLACGVRAPEQSSETHCTPQHDYRCTACICRITSVHRLQVRSSQGAPGPAPSTATSEDCVPFSFRQKANDLPSPAMTPLTRAALPPAIFRTQTSSRGSCQNTRPNTGQSVSRCCCCCCCCCCC